VYVPGNISLLILNRTTLFPGAILPLHIFEPRYGRMLSDVLESHRMFAIAMRRPGARREVPMPVACLGVVRVCVEVLESLDIKSRLVNVTTSCRWNSSATTWDRRAIPDPGQAFG
jgi:Lon protease-like protein